MMELRPIVVDENGIILGGNMRFRALQELYDKAGEIPDTWVKRADELTEDQKKEFIIKDNVAFGDWDFDALKGWDEPLDDWGVEIPANFDVEDEPTDLDADLKENPFVAKLTFENDIKLNSFINKYKNILQDEFDCLISVRGGAL